jgi:hypothetical protein
MRAYMKRQGLRYAAAAILIACSACAASTGPQAAQASHALRLRRAVGLGPVVRDALGGQIFGWGINEGGSDGVLTESVTTKQYASISAVETFDQTTGQITKMVAEQKSKSGFKELVALGIVANDVGLIDDERDDDGTRNDVFHLMSPVTRKKFTGTWTPPDVRNLLIEAVASQQSDPLVAIYGFKNYVGGGPEVIVSNVGENTFKPSIPFPKNVILTFPYLIGQDTRAAEAVVPSGSYSGATTFNVFHLTSGTVTTFLGADDHSGSVQGIAIDSATSMMCVTGLTDFSVGFYDLKTHSGSFESLPGAGGEQQTGAAIAADPVNHLFLVTQPLSSVSPSGSTIYVYAENGTLDETIDGFSFGYGVGIAIDATQRTGYVSGPSVNALQEFSY